MRRGSKPVKSKEAKPPVARKSPKDDGSRVVDLEKRLAAALEREADAQARETATAEILRVIASSPNDVQPVFDTIVENAQRLLRGWGALVVRFDGELLHVAGLRAGPGASEEPIRERFPQPVSQDTLNGVVVRDRAVKQIADVETDDDWISLREHARRQGWRANLGVPMLHDGQPIGAITVTRREPGAFSAQEVDLLKTFAAQAVIAIENVRLFNETKEALERQTATSEILRVIASSPTDVQPVFDTIVHNAVVLCRAFWGIIWLYERDQVDVAGVHNIPPGELEELRRQFPRPIADATMHKFLRSGSVLDVPDVEKDDDLPIPPEARVRWRARGVRSVVVVPMRRETDVVGAIGVSHRDVGAFSANRIDLLKTFADQAVIAIENVRLFKELQTSNRELTQALDQQTATSEILGVISGSPTDIQPVFDTIVRSAARLCSADDAQLLRTENDVLRLAASYGTIPGESTRPIVRTRVAGRAVIERRAIHVHDLQAEGNEFPDAQPWDIRSMLSIPLLREDHALGVIQIRRREVRQFTSAQIALLETFAAQAVIAIDNVRLFKELDAANRELSAASQHKSEFLANMSHELRTPLNAVIGFSEVLKDRMFGELNEKQEEYLKDIYASGTHLLSLINDILDLSKIEAGRMELELTDFDLPTAIENALMLVRERAGRRSIGLHTNIDDRLGQIQADERKVRQIVLNLLSNAIKFTPEGGRIDVGAVPKDGSVEVSVSDTGIGIASEDQEKVFEEFRQVGTAAKKVEGTGLGLTLCRKFVELHGGKIWVKSQEGVGSTFAFTIPVLRGE